MALRSLGLTRWLAVLAVGILLTACAPSPGPEGAPAGDAGKQEKQYGGVFQYASQSPPDGLYWYDLATIGSRGRPMSASHIWQGLINYDLVDPEADYEASGRYGGVWPRAGASRTRRRSCSTCVQG